MTLDEFAARLRQSRDVVFFTGAGISTESGVPDFRSPGGVWTKYAPVYFDEFVASEDARRRYWEWYAWRRFRIATCEPNDAHRVLADWSKRFPNFRLITQNVDGLHERAGTQNIIRLHGSIWEVSCWQQCAQSPKRWVDRRTTFKQMPPRCPYCGGLIRPAVVWFGETLETSIISQAMNAMKCDVFMTIGTSAVVYPAAGFLEQAKRNGAYTVEINPEATPATRMVDLPLAGGAEAVLPDIAASL